VSRGVLLRITVVGVLLLFCAFGIFEWAENRGLGDAAARTASVDVFMVVQLFYLFECRSLRRSVFTYNPFGNLVVVAGVAGVALLQLAFTYVPFMQTLFDTAALTAYEWLAIVAIGFGVTVAMDLFGIALRRLGVD
jgi:cation-transporting P-type ATPase F